MSKVIANCGFNDRFISFRMETYRESHSLSTLFGSPSGYVGSTDKPHLAQELDRYHPIEKTDSEGRYFEVSNVVLLFDELGKAHSQVRDSLLSLFDEGLVTARYRVSYSSRSRCLNINLVADCILQ